ncbi:MAG: transcription antitermination factor NusB [Firmicutes bacterium]|nr:transcription antitermination factor NusB [Candidatus Colimorpha enterica]
MNENTENIIHAERRKVTVAERLQAREDVFKLLFESEFQKDCDRNEFYREESENIGVAADPDYVKAVYDGVMNHITDLDAVITPCLNGRTLRRLSNVARVILRIAAYEMAYYQKEHGEKLDFSVSINEAVELAKKYDDDKVPGYVNGVLNSVAVSLGLKENG